MTGGCVLFVPWEARLGTFSRHCHFLRTPHGLVTCSIQFHVEILLPKCSLLKQGHQSQLFRTMSWESSKFKASFSPEQRAPVSGKQKKDHTFYEQKNPWKKCSEVTSSYCCFHSSCDCVVYQTFHSTTLEQAIFWDYGEGMQQLLVKLTTLQFFYGILFFLWTLRGKHQ